MDGYDEEYALENALFPWLDMPSYEDHLLIDECGISEEMHDSIDYDEDE